MFVVELCLNILMENRFNKLSSIFLEQVLRGVRVGTVPDSPGPRGMAGGSTGTPSLPASEGETLGGQGDHCDDRMVLTNLSASTLPTIKEWQGHARDTPASPKRAGAASQVVCSW